MQPGSECHAMSPLSLSREKIAVVSAVRIVAGHALLVRRVAVRRRGQDRDPVVAAEAEPWLCFKEELGMERFVRVVTGEAVSDGHGAVKKRVAQESLPERLVLVTVEAHSLPVEFVAKRKR